MLRDVCMSMFILVLFTIIQMWDQSKLSSVEEWIKNVVQIYASSLRKREGKSCHLQQLG
jgi:hypothetical protein